MDSTRVSDGGVPQVASPVGGTFVGPPVVALGALLGGWAAPALPPIVVVVALAAAVGLLVVAGRVCGPRPLRGLLAVALAAALVVGVGAGARRTALASGPLGERAATARGADVVVTVVGEPVATLDGRWRTDVRVDVLDGLPVGQRAEVALVRRAALGERLAGTVEVRPAVEPWRTRRHVAAVLRRPDLVVVGPPGAALAATTELRRRLAAVAGDVLPPAHAALATGLVTGDTTGLPEDVAVAMRTTGLTHLVAVSGSNVALVAAGAAGLGGLLGMGARGRRRTIAVAVVAFVVLTRGDPSVLRAAVMAGVVLLARARGRRVLPVHALGMAVLLLVLADPLLAGRPGLLLSAAATGGVLVGTPAVRDRLGRLVPRPPRGLGRGLDLLAVTLAAQLTVWPLLVVWGEDVALATVPANLVAVPAAAVASVLATTAAVVVVPWPGLAALLLGCARPALGVVIAAAEGLRWVGPVVSVSAPATVLLAAAASCWLVARPRGSAARAAAAVGLVVLVLPRLVAGGPAPSPGATGFTVTAIDVGQGDAFLLRAGDARVLVDTGRDDGRAAGWLRREGVDRLDLVVVTHPDLDHVGGLVDVLSVAEVGALWWAAPSTPDGLLAQALEMADVLGVPHHRPVAGAAATLGPLALWVMAPMAGRPHAGLDSEDNETSLVLAVDGPGGRVLLTGDTGPAAHAALLSEVSPALLRADVLTVPHHGSADVDLDLFAAVRASVAVASVGADNRYGHPTPSVLAALAAAGTHVRRTDVEGTVLVDVGAAATRRPVMGVDPGGVAPAG